uniref:Uncharacterized protein n=1 Tax=Nelumbo nucifera TaxID=4432 RepID=A0A822Z0E5_NELNU|nr:TPA_asm: hypothetical protein HUJ06_007117 [Nelumbo nucifera]
MKRKKMKIPCFNILSLLLALITIKENSLRRLFRAGAALSPAATADRLSAGHRRCY